MLLLILVLKGCSGYDDAGIWVQKMEDLFFCVCECFSYVWRFISQLPKWEKNWLECCFKSSVSVNTQPGCFNGWTYSWYLTSRMWLEMFIQAENRYYRSIVPQCTHTHTAAHFFACTARKEGDNATCLNWSYSYCKWDLLHLREFKWIICAIHISLCAGRRQPVFPLSAFGWLIGPLLDLFSFFFFFHSSAFPF